MHTMEKVVRRSGLQPWCALGQLQPFGQLLSLSLRFSKWDSWMSWSLKLPFSVKNKSYSFQCSCFYLVLQLLKPCLLPNSASSLLHHLVPQVLWHRLEMSFLLSPAMSSLTLGLLWNIPLSQLSRWGEDIDSVLCVCSPAAVQTWPLCWEIVLLPPELSVNRCVKGESLKTLWHNSKWYKILSTLLGKPGVL